jgi:hypothetical protein
MKNDKASEENPTRQISQQARRHSPSSMHCRSGVGDRPFERGGVDPSNDMVAKRFGRNVTLSGVVIDSGTKLQPMRSRRLEAVRRS